MTQHLQSSQIEPTWDVSLLLTLIADKMVQDGAASHGMHCIAPCSVDTAAAADDAVQCAAVLALHTLRTRLGACFALSAVKYHKNHSLALPKLLQQLYPENPFCKQVSSSLCHRMVPANFQDIDFFLL